MISVQCSALAWHNDALIPDPLRVLWLFKLNHHQPWLSLRYGSGCWAIVASNWDQLRIQTNHNADWFVANLRHHTTSAQSFPDDPWLRLRIFAAHSCCSEGLRQWREPSKVLTIPIRSNNPSCSLSIDMPVLDRIQITENLFQMLHRNHHWVAVPDRRPWTHCQSQIPYLAHSCLLLSDQERWSKWVNSAIEDPPGLRREALNPLMSKSMYTNVSMMGSMWNPLVNEIYWHPNVNQWHYDQKSHSNVCWGWWSSLICPWQLVQSKFKPFDDQVTTIKMIQMVISEHIESSNSALIGTSRHSGFEVIRDNISGLQRMIQEVEQDVSRSLLRTQYLWWCSKLWMLLISA